MVVHFTVDEDGLGSNPGRPANIMKKIALYKCLKCNYEWYANPGNVSCSICNHNYIKWINYEENYSNKFK